MRNRIILAFISVFLFAITACSDISPDATESAEQASIDIEYIVNETPESLPSDYVVEFFHGDQMVFTRIEQIIFRATHVVRAEVIDYRAERMRSILSDRVVEEWEYDSVYLWFNIYQLRILDVFMGNVEAGNIIEVAQRLTCYTDIDIPNPFKVHLTYGDELIFLLNCYEEHGYRPGPMSFAVDIYSVYHVPPLDAGLDFALDNFSPDNHFTLTVGDLERIAEEAGLRPSPSPPPDNNEPYPTTTPPNNNAPLPTATPSEGESDTDPTQSPTPTPQPTTSPTPAPTSPTPTPAPNATTETPSSPRLLLRFVIGSLYYTNHNGETLRADAPPFITGNRAHIPLRIIAEALGADVIWDRQTRTGYMTLGDTTIAIIIDQPLPDGMGTPVIINNRTFVPTRYIAETFGAEVRWDRENSAVYVYWPE